MLRVMDVLIQGLIDTVLAYDKVVTLSRKL